MNSTTHEIKITNYREFKKNTLEAFFDAELPSGLVFRGLMLHAKNDSRWVSLPSREYLKDGQKQFAKFIEFRDRETADRFRDEVIAALDQHLKAARS